ncbi:RNA-protein complex protein Nop10 [Candidatus Micrarchaeota archaeon]|nr:MAG: RNA-protein complex protein Nop10 [Candidatus Micrarchaeota archaeon]
MRCPKCGRYTMKNSCPLCGAETVKAEPPRFSPLDKYGEYRRRLLYERS